MADVGQELRLGPIGSIGLYACIFQGLFDLLPPGDLSLQLTNRHDTYTHDQQHHRNRRQYHNPPTLPLLYGQVLLNALDQAQHILAMLDHLIEHAVHVVVILATLLFNDLTRGLAVVFELDHACNGGDVLLDTGNEWLCRVSLGPAKIVRLIPEYCVDDTKGGDCLFS